MKKSFVVVACVVLGGIVPAGSVGAHPGVDCRRESHCITHCNEFHGGADKAVCLVTHNFPN